MTFTISRSIEIDAGHRVPTHGSKCANLHGHRYKVIAEVTSNSLHKDGVQSAMVMDFGFLKEVLTKHVDTPCDHGMILHVEDLYSQVFIEGGSFSIHDVDRIDTDFKDTLGKVRAGQIPYFFQEGRTGNPTKLLIVPFIPTAENLAEFWYHQMKHDIRELSNHLASLHRVIVWETPNCSAQYPL